MAILNHRVPADIAEAFQQLPKFVWAGGGDNVKQGYVGEMGTIPSMSDLGQLDDADLIHDAHPLYVLGLREIAEGAGICAAVHTGWRFFAGNTPGKILMGTVSRRGKCWRMTAGYYGERVSQALKATQALETLAAVEECKYEVRVLAVPGLNLEVFWLAAKEAKGKDLVVPFPAMPDQPIKALNTEPVYSMAHFLAAIRPLAQQRLAAG